MKIALVGAGSWGTALANLLAGNGGFVYLWDVNDELLESLSYDRENKRYLPGIRLREHVYISDTLENCIEGAEIVVFAVPTQHFRNALSSALPFLPKEALVVNVAKGIEMGSLMTPSMIVGELAKDIRFAVLTGPSHAEEVAEGMPTTLVVASPDTSTSEIVQGVFMSERFRVYTQCDVIGVELGGALKNIIALGAGISDGMGYGDNTKAALMTRGITEMARLGVSMGANRETFFGLSGIGDLIVTCTSQHSRNRRCGIMIGEGMSPDEATSRVGMVVEGIPTAIAARDLAKKLDVEMPITESICRIVNGEAPPETELASLMTRRKKHEQEDLLIDGSGR